MGRIETRLKALGLELPQPMRLPPGVVLDFPWVRIDGERAFVSGHGALNVDGSLSAPLGKVGTEVSEGQAYHSARLVGLAMLSSLRIELGDLDRVTGWLRVFSMVNAAPGFDRFPAVINGFGDLIVALYEGEVGGHARSAIGVSGLPFGLPVEIEAEVAIRG